MAAPLRLALLLLAAAPSAPAQLLPQRQYTLASSSGTLATGDLDGDGLLDLVTGGNYAPLLSVLLGAKGGGFQPYTAWSTPNSPGVALGDLNDDGVLDVVATDNAGTLLATRLGDGNGGFLALSTTTCPKGCSSTVVEDFDSDGDDDVAVITIYTGSVHLFLSDGAGGLSAGSVLPAGSLPYWMDSGDLDGDDHVDLVVADSVGSVVRLYFGDGAGSFVPATPLPSSSPNDVQVADADEDDDADLLVVAGADLVLHAGQGDGTFAPPELIGPAGESLQFADVDGNGFGDVASVDSTTLIVQLGGDGPAFGAPLPGSPVGSASVGLVLADASGDGQVDALIGNTQLPRVTVLRGTGFGLFEGFTDAHYAGEPVDLISADLDGDADDDVVVASAGYFGPGGVSILLADGGVLTSTALLDTNAFDLAVGDVDADGDLDLAGAGNGSVDLRPGNGAGGFGPATKLPGAVFAWDVALGDLDADGDADIAAALGQDADAVAIYLSDGAGGTSGPVLYPLGVEPSALALADLDLDLRLDVVALSEESDQVATLLGQGGGSLAPPSLQPVPPEAQELVVAALGPDDAPDLATIHGSDGGNNISVHAGDGLGGFAPPQAWAAGLGNRDLAAADVDGDGHADLLSADWNQTGSATLVLADGAGGFLPPRYHAGGSWPVAIAAGDIDGDGRLDVLVLNGSGGFVGGRVTVLRNLGPPEPWINLGQGKAGASGIPMLVGHGPLLAGEPITLELHGAAPLSAATLVVGHSPLFAPVKGGVLVPAADATLAVLTNERGAALLVAHWPSGVASGTPVWFQFWVAEASASFGFAASNGVTAVAP